jgi:hypothetical protein
LFSCRLEQILEFVEQSHTERIIPKFLPRGKWLVCNHERVCQVVCVNTFPRTGFASLSSRQVGALHQFPFL